MRAVWVHTFSSPECCRVSESKHLTICMQSQFTLPTSHIAVLSQDITTLKFILYVSCRFWLLAMKCQTPTVCIVEARMHTHSNCHFAACCFVKCCTESHQKYTLTPEMESCLRLQPSALHACTGVEGSKARELKCCAVSRAWLDSLKKGC